jgi:hypothetical protein
MTGNIRPANGRRDSQRRLYPGGVDAFEDEAMGRALDEPAYEAEDPDFRTRPGVNMEPLFAGGVRVGQSGLIPAPPDHSERAEAKPAENTSKSPGFRANTGGTPGRKHRTPADHRWDEVAVPCRRSR